MEFIVSTLSNSGIGSLRWAFRQANSLAGFDSIRFASSLTGGTISLASDLPVLRDQVEINGLTNSATAPGIAVDFNGTRGLVFRGALAEGSILKGLAIMGARGHGLTLDTNNVTVQDNYIGLMLDGITGNSNSGSAIRITESSSENLIGAIDPLTGQSVDDSFSNIINSSGNSGIVVESVNTNTISGNSISATGNSALGILVTDSDANTSASPHLRILDNRVSTRGADSTGVEVTATANTLNRLDVSGNTVTTQGVNALYSHGIRVLARDKGIIGYTQVHQNDVSTEGPASEGIFLSCIEGGSVNHAIINGNSVITKGSVPGRGSVNQFSLESDGINVTSLRSSLIRQMEISENQVTTFGRDADGIYVTAAIQAVIEKALLLNNVVSTLSTDATQRTGSSEGIKVLAYQNGAVASMLLFANTILQSESDGILLKANAGRSPVGGTIVAELTGNTSLNADSSGQTGGTPYFFNNSGDAGRILLVGETIEDVISNNQPSDPSSYTLTGKIGFIPRLPI